MASNKSTLSKLTSQIAALRNALLGSELVGDHTTLVPGTIDRLAEVRTREQNQLRRVIITVRLIPASTREFRTGNGFRERAIVLSVQKTPWISDIDNQVVKAEAEDACKALWAPVEVNGELLMSQPVSLRFGYDAEGKAKFQEGGMVADARKGDVIIAKIYGTLSCTKDKGPSGERYMDTSFAWKEIVTEDVIGEGGEIVTQNREITEYLPVIWVDRIFFGNEASLVVTETESVPVEVSAS